MSSDIVLKVQNIGKCYEIYAAPHHRLLQTLLRGKKQFYKEFWALKDISFEVKKGESLGIIGLNGSGKSTLLQIIAGTLSPTIGSVGVNGKVAALLELGSGFNPEFTGRENVYMNGAIMGFSRAQMDKKFDEIAAFADIGEYIDQPVRVYSSGMQMRLAFSVATSVRPDILIVDEALSVGDAFFQHKCIQRIRVFEEQGTTLLFVSHSADSIRMLCQRGIMLKSGTIAKIGDAATVMDYYRISQTAQVQSSASVPLELIESEHLLAGRDSKFVLFNKTTGTVSVDIISNNKPIHSGDYMSIRITVNFNVHYNDPHIGFGIRTKMGIMVYEANTLTLRHETRPVFSGDKMSVTFSFPCYLFMGSYELMVGVANGGHEGGTFDDALFFDQSFLLFDVAAGKNTGWNGIYDLQPKVMVEYL